MGQPPPGQPAGPATCMDALRVLGTHLSPVLSQFPPLWGGGEGEAGQERKKKSKGKEEIKEVITSPMSSAVNGLLLPRERTPGLLGQRLS